MNGKIFIFAVLKRFLGRYLDDTEKHPYLCIMKFERIEIRTTPDFKEHVSKWVTKSKKYTTLSDLIKKLLAKETGYKH